MGKKYVIELPENTHWIQWIMEGTKDHHPYMDYKQVEDLTPYTEPDLEQVRKEAYERGAEDMRKALRLLIDCDEDCLTIPDIFHTFREGSYHAVVRKHPAMEIIEKIRQYEQEKEEIQLWDEVINGRNFKGTVTGIEDNGMLTIFCQDGTWRKSHARYWKRPADTSMSSPKCLRR